jgi:hypothetical protein
MQGPTTTIKVFKTISRFGRRPSWSLLLTNHILAHADLILRPGWRQVILYKCSETAQEFRVYMYGSSTGQSRVNAPPVSMKMMYLGQFGSDQKTSEKEVTLIFNFKETSVLEMRSEASVLVPSPPSPLRRFFYYKSSTINHPGTQKLLQQGMFSNIFDRRSLFHT